VKSLAATSEKPAIRVLVASHDPAALRQLWTTGQRNGWRVQTSDSPWQALERAQSDPRLDLLFLDISDSDLDGIRTLRWLRKTSPVLPVVLLSTSCDPNRKREAMELGACGYLAKPIDEGLLEAILRSPINDGSESEETKVRSHDVEQIGEQIFFVAAGPAMRKLREQVELLANVNVPVLITGERGSGKEMAARLIHQRSPRSAGQFLTVNCAAQPPETLEQELFGHEIGTGECHVRAGKVELAENGTVLLNEATEMPLTVQSRLIRVLQENQVVRMGGETSVGVNVRILAATDSSLSQALAEKKLRADLYYLLSAFTLAVPALRERKEEIPILLSHFMRQLARAYGLPERPFSPVILNACRLYPWPGNLRELENFVKRHLVIGDEERALEELEKDHGGTSAPKLFESSINSTDKVGAVAQSPDLKSLVQDAKGIAEKNAIGAALEMTHWNRKAAARLLGVSYRGLLYKIDHYHMSPPEYSSSHVTNYPSKGTGF
jgi:DNA-binding NtrC family response regulator